jgi:hypothetical protein
MLEHRQFFRVFVLSIGEAGHEATTAPASGGTVAIVGKRARAKARQRTGCRSGLLWLVKASVAEVRQVAAGVARAGWTRSPEVRPGLRFQK